ncbi:MAG TPA: regulatory protein RecX [Alphaproteobacteria bacterium]|nr:regulatory protein RecX [Alphaproteobacteria bacterium]
MMPSDDQALKQAQQQAYRLLSYRSRTARELRDRLQQRGFEPSVVDEVVQRLEDDGYLNDRRLAEDWARYRLQTKPMGRRRLAVELQRRGLERTLIEEVLRAVYAESDEASLAEQAAKKRLRRLSGPPSPREYQRLVRYLEGQGFDTSVIKSVVAALFATDAAPDLPFDDITC